MRTGAIAAAHGQVPRVDGHPPSWCELAATWAVLVALVLGVVGPVAVLFPDAFDGPTRTLPNEPALMLAIFLNNLMLSALPLLGGWLAGARPASGQRGARLSRLLFLLLPALIVARSLFTIGAVGGSDLGWLLDAARWWLLELLALAAGVRTGLWFARHPKRRERCGRQATGRALGVIVGALAAGALIEVLSA